MNGPERSEPSLGEGIAAILRVGTIVTVTVISIAFVIAAMTGLPSRGPRPLLDVMLGAGPDAPIAVGLLALTLLPIISLAYAAAVFGRDGERRHLLVALGVLGMLVIGLVVAIAVGLAS